MDLQAFLGTATPVGPRKCAPTGELNACPGLYILDGYILPGPPAKHCTLTIMANADRIARHLAARSTATLTRDAGAPRG
jgi:cholesterol oxidase